MRTSAGQLVGEQVGPRVRVRREIGNQRVDRPGTKLGHTYQWRYELVCGHTVVRSRAGRQWCHCKECA